MHSLDFPYAHGGPVAKADFRCNLEDFTVTEELGWEPEGEGEHVYLHITKRGMNTQWLANAIARLAGVKHNDVGFCGQKDRHAVTTQWFSVYLPKGGEPDWSRLATEYELDVELLAVSRHTKKLRRGQHQSNRFQLTLRNLVLSSADTLEPLLTAIRQRGVPNYFGEQRFGHGGNNLKEAAVWLEEGRALAPRSKGMIMSAARSYLFNLVLAERVARENWAVTLPGDPTEEPLPTGPLWGRGRSLAASETLDLETSVLEDWKAWRDGLEHCGLKQERRTLMLSPVDMTWSLDSTVLTLAFALAPGQFATSVLREIAGLTNRSITG